MKENNKLIHFYNDYSQEYLKLSDLKKYNCYHLLFKQLSYFLKSKNKFKNILFIHKQPNDIDYLTILTNPELKFNFYMSGVMYDEFQKFYYYRKIDNVYDNYEFMSFCYQPKFDKNDWKQQKLEFNKIDTIILPAQVVDYPNRTIYLSDKKIIKFIKQFKNARIIGIGYEFSLTNKNTKKIQNYAIEFDEFISVKTNNLIVEESEK